MTHPFPQNPNTDAGLLITDGSETRLVPAEITFRSNLGIIEASAPGNMGICEIRKMMDYWEVLRYDLPKKREWGPLMPVILPMIVNSEDI